MIKLIRIVLIIYIRNFFEICILIVVGNIISVEMSNVLVIGIIIVIVILVIILNKSEIKCIGIFFVIVIFLLKVSININFLNIKNNIMIVIFKIINSCICVLLIVIIELNKYCCMFVVILFWFKFININVIVSLLVISIVMDNFE